MDEKRLDRVLDLVANEARSAMSAYLPFISNHEGYAVLLEELDELWDEIRKNKPRVSTTIMKKEAIQVAAMALRFLYDRCEI